MPAASSARSRPRSTPRRTANPPGTVPWARAAQRAAQRADPPRKGEGGVPRASVAPEAAWPGISPAPAAPPAAAPPGVWEPRRSGPPAALPKAGARGPGSPAVPRWAPERGHERVPGSAGDGPRPQGEARAETEAGPSGRIAFRRGAGTDSRPARREAGGWRPAATGPWASRWEEGRSPPREVRAPSPGHGRQRPRLQEPQVQGDRRTGLRQESSWRMEPPARPFAPIRRLLQAPRRAKSPESPKKSGPLPRNGV